MPTASTSARCAASSPRCSTCSKRAPPTWVSPPTTSSSRSATTSGPATRPAQGIDPVLFAQFPLLEDALRALGRRGVGRWSSSRPTTRSRPRPRSRRGRPRVEQASSSAPPTRTSAQCVARPRSCSSTGASEASSTRPAVREKFGVPPASIPDWLALVGDSADGFPGLPGWGAKSAAAVLARYGTIEAIPDARRVGRRRARRGEARGDPRQPRATRRRCSRCSRRCGPTATSARSTTGDWRGPTPEFAAWCSRLGSARLGQRGDARPGAAGLIGRRYSTVSSSP